MKTSFVIAAAFVLAAVLLLTRLPQEPRGSATGFVTASDKTTTGSFGEIKTLFKSTTPLTSSPKTLASQPALYAPKGNVTPLIDGELSKNELSDARYYKLQGSNGSVYEIYLKTLVYPSKSISYSAGATVTPAPLPANDLYIGLRVTHKSIKLVAPNKLTRLNFWFDEGNDTLYGSGPADGKLGHLQEDVKIISGTMSNIFCQRIYGIVEGCPAPSCDLKTKTNCWDCKVSTPTYRFRTTDSGWGEKCFNTTNPSQTTSSIWSQHQELADGHYRASGKFGPGWYIEGTAATGAGGRITFIGYQKVHDGYLEAEILMPLRGRDQGPPNDFDDVSDLNVGLGDAFGFMGITTAGEYALVFPENGDFGKPTTFAKITPLR